MEQLVLMFSFITQQSKEEAKNKALTELNITEENLIIRSKEEKQGLLKLLGRSGILHITCTNSQTHECKVKSGSSVNVDGYTI